MIFYFSIIVLFDLTCVHCGQAGYGEVCTNPPKCRNCGSDHPSSSVKCYYYILEQETITLQIREKLSYWEAKNTATNKMIKSPTSYASVVAAVPQRPQPQEQLSLGQQQQLYQRLQQSQQIFKPPQPFKSLVVIWNQVPANFTETIEVYQQFSKKVSTTSRIIIFITIDNNNSVKHTIRSDTNMDLISSPRAN